MMTFIEEFTTAERRVYELIGTPTQDYTNIILKVPFHCAQYKKNKHSLHPSPTNTTNDNGVVFGRDNSQLGVCSSRSCNSLANTEHRQHGHSREGANGWMARAEDEWVRREKHKTFIVSKYKFMQCMLHYIRLVAIPPTPLLLLLHNLYLFLQLYCYYCIIFILLQQCNDYYLCVQLSRPK